MKIDKGIEIPPPYFYEPRSEAGRIAKAMDVGDSVLCDKPGDAQTIRGALKRLGRKPVLRKSAEGWRVWRTV